LLAAAEVVGYGAVKYFDLKQHPTTNYVFSYDRMLDTKGAFFLNVCMYVCMR
jgi:arginyl-tRNA synthetase